MDEQLVKKLQELYSIVKDEISESLKKGSCTIIISHKAIAAVDIKLAEEVLNNPKNTLKVLEKFFSQKLGINVKVRIKDLPKDRWIRIRDIRSEHIGKLIETEGIIKVSTEVRPVVVAVKYYHNKCGGEFWYNLFGEDSDKEQFIRFKIEKPKVCSVCGESEGRFVEVERKTVDMQRLLVEETPDQIERGEQPAQIIVFLTEDLCEPRMERRTIPGTRIRIVGVVEALQNSKTQAVLDLIINAVYIEPVEKDIEDIKISEEDELKIKELAKSGDVLNILARSIAPSIHGKHYEHIKKALILQLVGGVKKIRSDGTRVRGDIHMLLIGDPGTGKSITPESKIVVIDKNKNINIVPIKEFVDQLIGDYINKVIIYKDTEVLDLLDVGKEFYTISVNPTTLLVEVKRITAISRHKINDKIVKIITKNRMSVRGTMDHSFLVLGDSGLIVKKGSELMVGDKIPVLTKNISSLFKGELKNTISVEFDDIVSIQCEHFSGYVYDLSVEDNENFLANNIFVHNSQILQFISKVAPKARFVSGVTASAVGLTANVRRDEFLKGGWALEAGALVLASGGIVCIDELDKISKDEMSTLHEALEQQQITVNKANIHATLKTEVSVLAAANPKFGRWDKMKSIVDQIDLPPPILNRFDLIFILRDEPDEELDRLVAEGVVKGLTENIEGIIPPELLRKYIIYTKKTTPVWTESAKKKVVDFYLTLRMAAKDQQTIPISARQLESIIRLAEASARVRLSKKVTEEDVELAKSLLMKSLREVGLNPETKTIDIDILNVGISSTQRARLSTVYEMIKDLQKDFPDGVPFQEIVNAAKEHKIEEEKVKEALDRLLREGEVYEPKPGFYKIAS